MSNSLTQTTLSAAITANQTTFGVASVTNISAPTNNFFQQIYVLDPGSMRGELMTVLAVSGTQITVSRLDQFKGPHVSGAIVIINPINASLGTGFIGKDPDPVPSVAPLLTWVINVVTGAQWLYSTVTASWVPGFNNLTAPASPTVAVVSANTFLPSGPLLHATGTTVVKTITVPSGFTSGAITVIGDGVFNWDATGNIVVAGTVTTAGSSVTFTYDFNLGKWYPSRLA